MASRILFEEEIADQILAANGEKSIDDVTIKQEESMDVGNDGQMDGEPHRTENYDDHIIIQPLETTISYQNQDVNDDISKGNSEGNTDQLNDRGGKVSSNEGNIDQNYTKEGLKKGYEIPIVGGNSNQDLEVKGNKGKGKKRPSELELLGVDIKVNIEETQDKYDVFGDDNQIYRKYKLRKSEQPISYKEPSDWKPKRRISTDNKPILLACTMCFMEFDTPKALHIHLRCHDTVSEYICSLCLEKFQTNADLIAHKSTHNSESFLCKICKIAFSDHCDYLLHKLTHSIATEFTCPECGLKYPKHSYKLHIYTHFNKKVNCPICSFVCNGEFNLQNHLNGHKYKVTCVECGKICKNKKYYEYHMSVHTGIKKYQCLYCGKGFGTHSMRKVHTRLHTGEKPYTCDICGHKSKQDTDMKRHKITHESEKKYKCDVCSKKFFYKESLISHFRIHTKKNLYPCPECDDEFLTIGGLKCHLMFKHLPDRPVECSICDKRFINNNQLRKHTRSKIHKRKMYGVMTKKECQ